MHSYELIKMLEGKQGDSISGCPSLGGCPEHLKLMWRCQGDEESPKCGKKNRKMDSFSLPSVRLSVGLPHSGLYSFSALDQSSFQSC